MNPSNEKEKPAIGARAKAARLAGGARSGSRWLLDGEVVEHTKAQARANVCIGCPYNQDGSLFEDLTGMAAMALKTMLEIKNKRFLHVENEHLLRVCEKCGCETSVKIHAPIKIVLKEMTKQQMEELPEFCWQKRESVEDV